MEEDPTPKRPSTFPLFSRDLALQPITVVGYATESRKQFEDFIEAFRRRIVVELQYASNLEMVSMSLDRFIQPGSEKAISFISSAFKVQNEQRARQAKQLAESLTTQVHDVCLSASKEQISLIKKVQKQVKSMMKKLDNLNENLEQCQENFQKASKQFQQLVISKTYTKHTSSIPQQKKSKLILKSASIINERKEIQHKFLSATQNYNTFVDEYNKLIPANLNQLQTQIRDQITLQSDCLRKLIVAEVSMFKNIEYDLINISKQMEILDTQKDVQIFTKEAKVNNQNLILDMKMKQINSQKQKRKSISSETVSTVGTQSLFSQLLEPKEERLNKGIMATCLKNIQQGVFTQLLIHKKSKQFKSLIEARWNQLTPVNQDNQSSTQLNSNHSLNQSGKEDSIKNEIQQQPPQIDHKQNLRATFDGYFGGSMFIKDFMKARKEEEKDDVRNEVFDNFIIITRYIFQIWNGKTTTRIESKKKNKASQSSSSQSPFLYIKKLLSLNHFYRLISYSFIQSFRSRQAVMIQNFQRAQQIGKFINCLIIKSSKQTDIFVLRGLLSLLFTFYFIDNNSKKHMALQPTVYKNSIWRKQDFWDAAIFQSTYEQMLSFGSQNDQSHQQTILREKNLIFSQLALYCHYMIILGITSKSVRQIVGRFCRLYEMNDEQNRDLSKMITNTIKQYKEIFSLQIKDSQKDTINEAK